MTDDYTPLTDEQVARAQRLASGVASISVQPSFIKELVDTIAYWKRRAETAEREALRDDMPPMIGDPRGGRGPAGW